MFTWSDILTFFFFLRMFLPSLLISAFNSFLHPSGKFQIWEWTEFVVPTDLLNMQCQLISCIAPRYICHYFSVE